MSKQILTQENLKSLFDYDPETGVFIWRVQPNGRVLKGSTAGRTDAKGYHRIGVGGTLYSAHRLAWLYVTGAWPLYEIDHIDGQRANNAFRNLRDVTKAKNLQNQKRPHAASSSGVLGVSRANSKWQAAIRVENKQHYLGVFDTPEMAHAAYLDAKRRLHSTCTI